MPFAQNSLLNTMQADSISDFSKGGDTSRGINISVGGNHFQDKKKKTDIKFFLKQQLGQINEQDLFKQAMKESKFPERRAMSLVRGSMQATDLLSANNTFVASNASTNNILDTSKEIKQKRSLNFILKKREAERIDQENQMLLKKLNSLQVSPHLNTVTMKKQYNDVKKYKKTLTGTSHRFQNISQIVKKAQARKLNYNGSNLHRQNKMMMMNGRSQLPPLPDGYYNDQIDEVSSARTSVIERESEINIKANQN